MREEEIFHRARTRRDREERAAYLEQACGGDAALRASIEALLRADVGATGFMDRPPDVAATVDVRGSERPGTVIGPCKLLQEIGEGGMGTVFMVEQAEPVRRMVALKLVRPGVDSRQIVARFEAERQALAMMDHPSIARVLDAGTTGNVAGGWWRVEGKEVNEAFAPSTRHAPPATPSGRPYFVMELVKGIPIADYCDQNHLSPRERLELFVPVCRAIQHAHQKGIIHRDLKPSNVLVARYDDRPVPKVIDFGVAKATGPRLTERTLFTQFGQLVGTLEYMSPEQAAFNALDIDTRSDISAGAFAADVRRYLEDEPVQACPPSAGYRLRKFVRRNRGPLAAAVALAVALIAGVGSVIAVQARADRERAAAAERATRRAATDASIAAAIREAAERTDEAWGASAITRIACSGRPMRRSRRCAGPTTSPPGGCRAK
jgi:hypothetical protein